MWRRARPCSHRCFPRTRIATGSCARSAFTMTGGHPRRDGGGQENGHEDCEPIRLRARFQALAGRHQWGLAVRFDRYAGRIQEVVGDTDGAGSEYRTRRERRGELGRVGARSAERSGGGEREPARTTGSGQRVDQSGRGTRLGDSRLGDARFGDAARVETVSGTWPASVPAQEPVDRALRTTVATPMTAPVTVRSGPAPATSIPASRLATAVVPSSTFASARADTARIPEEAVGNSRTGLGSPCS